jgi:PAS domain S-box-containing protein
MADPLRDDVLYEQLSDPRFRALTERAQDIISVLDGAIRVRYVSPAIERVLGYRPAELHGVSAPGLTHPEDLPRVEEALARLASAPGMTVGLAVRGRHKDGSYRHLELVAHNLLHDSAIGAIVVNARDVTEQRETLVALAASERRFRMFAENARDVVARYRLLPEPGLEYVSPSVERITGYAPAELYAEPQAFVKLIAAEDRERLLGLISGRSRDELSALQTLCWVRKDGVRVWMEQQTVLIYDSAGRLTAAETIARDISEKVRLEQQLREAQKLEAIGTLAAGLAHDFNNLLMTIFAHVGRLEAQLETDTQGRESLAVIRDTARGAAALSDQLLAFARKGARKSKVVDLGHAVSQLEMMFRRLLPKNVAIVIERSDAQCKLRCDPNQLDQLLLNLALNARDAMPDGGTLTIGVAPAREAWLQLTVQDTGVGIAEEDLPHVFEPFFTSKRQPSSGLGLAVVYGIVESLDGRISVRSRPREGTCFAIELPTTEAATDPLPDQSDDAARPQTQAGGGETLLLVEDQRAVREVLAQLLREAGYRVLEAEGGRAALELVEHEAIALLVTDMVMPDMGGAALVEHLRKRRPDLPAVCMSGYAGDEVDPRVTPGERTAFLSKPFVPEELLATLRRLLR